MKNNDEINQATKTNWPGGYTAFRIRGGVCDKEGGSQLNTSTENILVNGPRFGGTAWQNINDKCTEVCGWQLRKNLWIWRLNWSHIIKGTDCVDFEWKVYINVRGHSGWMFGNNQPFVLGPTFEDGWAHCWVWPRPQWKFWNLMIARTLPEEL